MEARDGFKRLRSDHFGFHLDRPTAYEHMAKLRFEQNVICEVNEIVLRANKKLGVAIAKNSTFRELTSRNLIWMRESGVFHKHQKFFIRTKPDCTSNNEIYRSVMFKDVSSIFFILIFTHIFSIAVLVFENIAFALDSKRPKQNERK